MKLKQLALSAILTGFFVPGVFAAVIYDNGDYNEGGAIEVGWRIAADDFVLSSGTSVSGAELVVRDVASNAWDRSTLSWFLYGSGSTPGSLIDSGLASSINVDSLGASTFAGKELLEVSFDFGSTLSLTASTQYWLGLSFDQGSNGVQWLMSDVFPVTGDKAANSPNGGTSWNSSARDLNFKLVSAVPEPATLVLFGLGLAGMGFMRKKKAS